MISKSIFHTCAIASALIVCCAPAKSQTPTYFVHGIDSNGQTWLELGEVLANQLPIWPRYPSLVSDNPISQQASQLVGDINSVDYGNPVILVGHSQGGLVSRKASTRVPVAGVITIGTPHSGAPIATHAGNIQGLINTTLIDFSETLPLEYPYGWSDEYFRPWDNDGWLTVAISGAIGGAFVYGADFVLRNYLHGQESLGDLAPWSSFLDTLNSSDHLSQELAQVPYHQGLVSVPIAYWCAGPLRLRFSANIACQQSWQITGYGLDLALLSYDVLDEIDYSSFDSVYLIIGAFAAADLAEIALTWEPRWCLIIGTGYSCEDSDGIVPATSQIFPGATNIIFTGPPHTGETSFTDEDGGLNSRYFLNQSILNAIGH